MPTRDAPQNNKQHAVPQNIMDVEFKLIGDLTMRQFVYLLVFLGLAYFLFTLNISIVFRLPLTLFSALIGLAFAFMPLEDRGLDEWVVNFINAVYQENQMVWRKEPTPPSAFVYENLSMVKQELITLAPTASRRKLEKFLEIQDKQGPSDPFETLEQEYIQKVQDAYVDYAPAPQVQAPVTTEVITEEPPQKIEIEEEKEPEEKGVQGEKKQKPKKEVKKQKEERVEKKEEVEKVEERELPQIQLPREVPLDIVTPDRHAGRKFSNLTPDEGSLTLPIRGERVIALDEEEQRAEDSVNEKAEQLRSFINQIESGVPKQTVKKTEVKEDDTSKKLKNEKQLLEEKIEKLEKELAQIKDPQEKQRKQNHINTLIDRKDEAMGTLSDIKEKPNKVKLEKQDLIPEYLEPKTPNVVAGVVKNIQNKRVPNVLITIKDYKEDPVRVVKTNELGEFAITNPLPDGQYKMEIDVNEATGFNFDIIDFVADGKIIPAMKIEGK